MTWPRRRAAPFVVLLSVLAAMLWAFVVATPAQAAAGDPVLVAAGDIACDPANAKANGSDAAVCQAGATANTIASIAPKYLLPLGDTQYRDNASQGQEPTPAMYQNGYGTTWGRLTTRVPGLVVRPIAGNHEYGDLTESGNPPLAAAANYFQYFGPNGLNQLPAGVTSPSTSWYSYDIPVAGGSWHVVALDGECYALPKGGAATGCAAGSPQETWLRQDLAAHSGVCTLAAWHEPRWATGGNASNYSALWSDLVAAHATLSLHGHEHDYERYPPLNASGSATPGGVAEIIVGSGGVNHEGPSAGPGPAFPAATDGSHFGVLALTLHAGSADYAFRTTDGAVRDPGTLACAPAPSPTPTPTGSFSSNGWTVGLTSSATSAAVGGSVTLTATANKDPGPTPYFLCVYDTTTGAQVKRQGSGTTATFTVSQTAAGTHRYVAHVDDGTTAGTNAQAISSPVVVTWGTTSPSPTPSPTLTASPTPSPTPTRTPTPTPSASSPTPTPSPSGTFSSNGWTVSLTSSATSAAVGGSVTLTATANKDPGPTTYFLCVYDTTTGAQVKRQGSGTTATFAVSQSVAGTHRYVAQVDDGTTAGTNAQAISSPVVVTWGTAGSSPTPSLTAGPTPTPTATRTATPTPSPTASGPFSSNGWTVTLSANTTTAAAGGSVTLTATANKDPGPTPYFLCVYDTTTGTQIKRQGSGTTATFAVTQTAAGTHRYVAQVDDGTTAGTNAQAISSPVSVSWS